MPDRQQILFVTPVPSFYKNLLFRQLQHFIDVKVLFTNSTKIERHGDFFNYLPQTGVLATSQLSFWGKLKLAFTTARSSQRVYFNGWDDIYSWLLIFFLKKSRNYLIVESSFFEYSDKGAKQGLLKYLKKLYLSRIGTCVASGAPHKMLLEHLGYKGNIRLSHGVGLLDFDYKPIHRQPTQQPITEFLYVGRLAPVKGIDTLVQAFQHFPECRLHLVGMPEKGFAVPKLANVVWHGYKNRSELPAMFQAAQVFVLPSIAEPWGLVVEEALYHGIPVLVSDKVGCRIDVVDHYQAGYTFKAGDVDALCQAIRQMRVPSHYNAFLLNISHLSFADRQKQYVSSFLA